jgi:Flp pilus assembly protein TadB
MSRSRVRRRSDGILEILALPQRGRRRHPLALALASAVVSGAAVFLLWLAPRLIAAVWLPLAAAVLLASALLLWRPRRGGASARQRSSGPPPALVRPIRPAPGASTRGG